VKATITIFWILFCINCTWAQYKLYEEGVRRYNAKDYYGAIETFSDFLTRQARDRKFDADAYYWRGMSAYMLKDYSIAIEDFRQSITLNHPKKGNAYWLIAKCNDYLNLHTESITNYTAALNILLMDNKAQAELLAGRSAAQAKLGNTQAAIGDIKQALSLQPGNEDYRIKLEYYSASSQYETEKSITNQINKEVIAGTGQFDNPKDKVPLKEEPAKQELAKQEPAKQEPITSQPATSSSTTNQTNREVISGTGQVNNQKDKVPSKEEPAKQEAITSQPPPNQQVVSVVLPVTKDPTLEELYKDEKRIALVIGNSNYSKEIGVLKNPVNDAIDFAESLKAMNFEVILITDASYGKIRAEMMKFRDKLNDGDRDKTVGLFYYAGHGLQYEGENYIVPVDAEIQFEDDIPRFCFPIQKMVLNQMELTNSRMNIVILDACRNNPFPVIHRSIGESSGLGEMKKARGAFIAYATSPGSVASDGNGRNGLYTQELIKAMNKPNLTIEQVFKEVRANVLRQSGEKQNPWENSNIIGDFYFKLN
jgi:tetratricopeptide (TPR) repeat protein